jgi:hypothetical protein
MLSARLDIMFLADAARPEEVGYYNIAARISDLVGYPLTAINLMRQRCYQKNIIKTKKKYCRLQKILLSLHYQVHW